MRPIEDPGRGGDRGRGEDREGRSERERDMEVQPPRLLSAGLDPLRHGERSEDVVNDALRREESDSEEEREKEHGQWGQWTSAVSIERAKSHSPPGLGKGKGDLNRSGSESPRKIGRNRTDTMVLSDATTFAERIAENLARTLPEPAAKRETELEELAPTPSETEAGETGGLKEPAPSLASDSNAESASEASSESSPAETETEPQPKPQPETEPGPEPVPTDDDQPSSSTLEDPNVTKAPAIEEVPAPTLDDSKTQIPPKDAEPAPHTAGTEPEAESSSSSSAAELKPTPTDGPERDKDTVLKAEAEAEAEAAKGSESQSESDRPEAADGEKPAAVSEAETKGFEGGAAKRDAVLAVADDNEATNIGEGKDDGDDFVPVDKAELLAGTDAGDSEEEREKKQKVVETSAEEKEESKQGKMPGEVLAAVGGAVEKTD
jgi:hypothetical protein